MTIHQTPPKGVTGHLLGGAGGIEAVLTALAVRDQRIPPTANLTEPDPDLDLTLPIHEESRPIRWALSNSFGFGGQNAVLLFEGEGATP